MLILCLSTALIIFANSLDPDQDWQKVCHSHGVPKIILNKSADNSESMKKYPIDK